MVKIMLSNSKKTSYCDLHRLKNLRKACFFASVILLIGCIFAIFYFSVSNAEIANADSRQNSNEIQNAPSTDLYLVGEFTDWKVIKEDKYRLEYDDQKGWYKQSIAYIGSGNCDWKIIWQNDWSNSWGGHIDYSLDKSTQKQVGQCVGLIGNKNLNPPNNGACNFDVYFKFFNNNNTVISVNKEPVIEDNPSITVSLWDENRKLNGKINDEDSIKLLKSKNWSRELNNHNNDGEVIEIWKLDITAQSPLTESDYMDVWSKVKIESDDCAGFKTTFTGFKPDVKNEIVLINLDFHAKYELVYEPCKNNGLELFGEFNNWGNKTEQGVTMPGIPMQYSEENKGYFVDTAFSSYAGAIEGQSQFKIRKPGDSRFNRGGDALYADNQQSITQAVAYGDNLYFPKGTKNYKIWLTTIDGVFDKIYVNNEPPKEGQILKTVKLNSDSDNYDFMCSIDSCLLNKSANLNLCLPLNFDCVFAENNKIVSDIQTMTLKIVNRITGETHECVFQHMPQGQIETLPLNRIRYEYGDDDNVSSVTFWMSALPNNVQILTTSNSKFQYAFENSNANWQIAKSVIMNTGVNSPNLSISDNIAEGGAIIDDNIGHKVLIKECDSLPHIDAQCVSYDKTTGFVYIDYDKGHIDQPKYITAETSDSTISRQLVIMFAIFAIIFFIAELRYCSIKRRQHG